MRSAAAVAAAGAFRLDIKGAEIRRAMAAAGIRAVLLKGPAFARQLYRDPTLRTYSDVDLLVDPRAMVRAEKVLIDQGFRRFDQEAPVRQTDPLVGAAVGVQGASHAVAWVRDRDSFVVDVHDSLPQVGVPEDVVWREITEHLDVINVGGASAETLDRPATALLVTLHAAHHGPSWRTAIRDLIAALETFDVACWEAARDLAITLKAESQMGIGLGLAEGGQAIAQRLSLPTEPTPAQRSLWAGKPWSASIIEALKGDPGFTPKARLLARVLWPSPRAMRRGSALARRGRRGLLAARLARLFQLIRQAPSALLGRRIN